MPSLVLCSRKTCFAGDDLRFFSLVESLFRLLQLALAISLITFTSDQKKRNDALHMVLNECEENGDFSRTASKGMKVLYAYDTVAIVLSVVGLAAAIPMLFISGRGTPTDPEPRKALFWLCCFNLSVINIFRVLGFMFGFLAINVLREYCECLSGELDELDRFLLDFREACPAAGAWLAVMITLVVTHGIDFVAAGLTFLYFACKLAVPSKVLIPSESRWRASLVCCFGCSSTLSCCLFGTSASPSSCEGCCEIDLCSHCVPSGGFQAVLGDFTDFALIMANYFNNNDILDVTASDVVAGLVMVVRVQQEKLLETRERLQKEHSEANNGKSNRKILRTSSSSKIEVGKGDSAQDDMSGRRAMSHPKLSHSRENYGDGAYQELSTRELLSAQHPRERYLMAEGARFMPMAQATYTWVSFLLEHPITGLCDLSFRILTRCGCFCRSPKDKISGDYLWEPHFITLKVISGLDEDDIIYASFKQSITAIPYMIALDHEWKSVVVAIRGTLSFESLLADITLRPDELTKFGEECGFDGKDHYCHAGILASTDWIYRDIIR
jgi:hypothetical protein